MKINAGFIVVAIIALAAIAIGAVVGIDYGPGGFNATSTPIAVTILGFLGTFAIQLLQLAKTNDSSVKLEESSQKLEKIDKQTDGGLTSNVKSAVVDAVNEGSIEEAVHRAVTKILNPPPAT